jgi:hypothetical protein
VDFTKDIRQEIEADADFVCSVAELTIWIHERGIASVPLRDLMRLRFTIMFLKKQLESMTLKLWYSLPHVVP